MKLIRPSYQILTKLDRSAVLQAIEAAGRTCYKSEERISAESAGPFVLSIIQRGHESVLEHQSISVRFICDRGVSHEMVRHRIASFSQESTRYVNYGKKGIEFVIPPWTQVAPQEMDERVVLACGIPHVGADKLWLEGVAYAAETYNQLLSDGWKPEQARSILPNALKTEVVVTANLREWRHILRLRTSKAAHPQMRELMDKLLGDLMLELPELFGDIGGR